ncbi:MAG: aminopeptidase N [Rhodospirillaceae bacterium]|nr:aminopeptidase N [Rhodospirillaceae bacterium]
MTKTDIRPIYLKDYAPPPYLIDTMDLAFDLDPHRTKVTATSHVRKNSAVTNQHNDLVLDGENLTLISVKVNDHELDCAEWKLTAESLTLHGVPKEFTLTVCTEIEPASNKALEGLFMSGGRFCTQCEAEGFRRITYYLDRPDVLARFTVRINADVGEFPVLLSNGNCIDRGVISEGRHYAVWEDPFPKPCYLFALVAGKLACLSDTFTTASEKQVSLYLYVEAGKESRATYAMDALKRAMEWDERIYGLEYDLDEFNIVAVSDFNMGAMENKSLNIFNDKFILADPDTATDTDYAWIESVVAHEYFHNWTGNRVTCRDWFQLSLKEGLTVFRDQQFSADQRSAAVQRVEDVKRLRNTQFVEDSGPLAHSVRPESYAEINNFYTHTVYEKGAEVVRMIHTLVGAEQFRKGIDLYFERHDGQAVTCEDFVAAMADSSGFDLDQFLLWYKQAGTPTIEATGEFNPDAGGYKLTLTQSCPATPGQLNKKPMQIPIAVGFVDASSGSLETTLVGSNQRRQETHLICMQNNEAVLIFEGLLEHHKTIAVSLNRGFTAPTLTRIKSSPGQLATLIVHDPDLVSRWTAAQELAATVLMRKVKDQELRSELSIFDNTFDKLLDRAMDDPATTALLLELPSEKALSELDSPIDPVAIYDARHWLKHRIGELFYDRFALLLEECRTDGPFVPSAQDAGFRSLKNIALNYIVSRGSAPDELLASSQYQSADNLTDRVAALRSLNETSSELRRTTLDAFENQYSGNELVLDKWLMLEASYCGAGVLDRIESLLSHPRYDNENPNRIRALIGTFATENTVGFHRVSGEGYKFVADQIISIDKFNPQSAARIAGAFQHWKRYGPERESLMRQQLLKILDVSGLSEDVVEIVSKSLGH